MFLAIIEQIKFEMCYYITLAFLCVISVTQYNRFVDSVKEVMDGKKLMKVCNDSVCVVDIDIEPYGKSCKPIKRKNFIRNESDEECGNLTSGSFEVQDKSRL